MDSTDWANMGQGAPETGPLPGSPSRDFHMNIQDAELEYAPTAGIKELREKVAVYYNELYRCVIACMPHRMGYVVFVSYAYFGY